MKKDRLARCIEEGLKEEVGDRLDEVVRATRQRLENMRPGGAARDVAKKASAIGDPIRVAMLRAMGREGTLCVCELMHVADRSQPSTSHHLRILREAGLVKELRRGKWIFYSLADDSILGVLQSIEQL